jgi:hypothetical protein
MQLTLKHYDITISVETSDDITIDDLYHQFNALLISATFSQEQINNWIIDKAEELNCDKSV